MRIFVAFLWIFFWQSASKEPEETSNISFYLSIFAVAIISFIFGVLLTTVYFLSTRPKVNKDNTAGQLTQAVNSQGASIKQCPKCHSTYTDEDLVYCLRDGLTLKVVGIMPIPNDPDKTHEFRG